MQIFGKAIEIFGKSVEIKLPNKVIGKNTVHSIQSGIMFGYVGLVKEMLEKIKLEDSISGQQISNIITEYMNGDGQKIIKKDNNITVSYTHLTLQTSDLV